MINLEQYSRTMELLDLNPKLAGVRNRRYGKKRKTNRFLCTGQFRTIGT